MVIFLKRGLLSLCMGMSLLALVADGGDARAAVADDDVHVERSARGFTVDLLMHTPVSRSTAWAVLTDFDHMAAFVPNVRTSRIIQRGDNALRVSQTGTARYGVLSIDFESVRDIRLVPEREIHAHAIGGNVRHMDSVMRLEAEAEGTRLQYHAEVEPDFWLPPLVGPSLVRHETAEQFSAILQEMLRRR